MVKDTSESGPIARWLSADHVRLAELLDHATAGVDVIDPAPYAKFRSGLLRHIAVEEKILLTAAQRAAHGTPLALASRLSLDHGAIAALLVPTPTATIIATLREILAAHNELEEAPDGLYATCDRLLAAEAADVVTRMVTYPEPRLNPHNDAPEVMPAVERALDRAGYRLRDIGS